LKGFAWFCDAAMTAMRNGCHQRVIAGRQSGSMLDSRSSFAASSDPDRGIMQRAYRAWAPAYDLICGGLFARSRRRVVSLASMAGRHVLEIGVGTGLSLGDYEADMVVTGIDASEAMIARAHRRAQSIACAEIRSLRVMDAENLTFADGQFDAVVAQFLITLVERPERVLDEAWRVVRPGGALFLLNHFRSRNPVVASFETRIAPLLHHVGLRPDFPFERVESWAAPQASVSAITRIPAGPFECFSIVRIAKAA
jgi:phosphatidylethanolamine/phosphatidyl-N-methylethanolamine N-methyltransferase